MRVSMMNECCPTAVADDPLGGSIAHHEECERAARKVVGAEKLARSGYEPNEEEERRIWAETQDAYYHAYKSLNRYTTTLCALGGSMPRVCLIRAIRIRRPPLTRRSHDRSRTPLAELTPHSHSINSAIIKLSKLTHASPVYRGVGGRVLPPSFWKPNAYGVRGGIDPAFLSTTLDEKVPPLHPSLFPCLPSTFTSPSTSLFSPPSLHLPSTSSLTIVCVLHDSR